MNDGEPVEFHTEEKLRELNETIVTDLEKFRYTMDEEWTVDDDEQYGKCLVTDMRSPDNHVYRIVSATGFYASSLAFQYSIAQEIGMTLTDETKEELLADLPDEFPLDPKEVPNEAAGLIALSKMDGGSKDELNYRVKDVVNSDRVVQGQSRYDGVIYEINISADLFPSEPTHNIHRTKTVLRAIQSAVNDMHSFIRYTFTGAGEKNEEDIATEGLML